MKKVEMVRCFVTSPEPNAANPEHPERSVRYVPSDIYRLWRYLMEGHNYGDHEKNKVVEVSFIYFRDSDVGRPVIRYFPLAHLEGILNFFLKNFSEAHIQGGMKKTPGFFISKK
jgi:hypothetical protein